MPDQDFALSRDGAVGGVVTDLAAGGTAVAGVAVTVTGPSGTTELLTDAAGNYFLGGLSAGTYTITVAVPPDRQAAGAVTRTVTITAAGEIFGAEDFAFEAAVGPTPSPEPSPSTDPSPSPSPDPSAGPTATPEPPATGGIVSWGWLAAGAGLLALGVALLTRRRDRRA